MNWFIWKLDMMIYHLFYWRWNKKLINRSDIRRSLIRYLKSWDAIDNEPAMGIGTPPKLNVPKYRKEK